MKTTTTKPTLMLMPSRICSRFSRSTCNRLNDSVTPDVIVETRAPITGTLFQWTVSIRTNLLGVVSTRMIDFGYGRSMDDANAQAKRSVRLLFLGARWVAALRKRIETNLRGTDPRTVAKIITAAMD